MTQKVTDEMLMAFVDGETDAATASMVERAIATDPALAERAEGFRASRTLMRDAFGSARGEPVPEVLIRAALRGEDTPKVVPFTARRTMPRLALPLAACLALAVGGVGGYLAGGTGGQVPDAFGRAALAEALGATASGQSRTVTVAGGEATFETLATYRVEGGLCRSFALAGAVPLSGIGCDRGAGWTVDLTVASAGGEGGYAPASGAALQSIDAYLDALEASAALTPEEEAELSAR